MNYAKEYFSKIYFYNFPSLIKKYNIVELKKFKKLDHLYLKIKKKMLKLNLPIYLLKILKH